MTRCAEAGVTALIGMGSSPGLTNVIARLAADTLLDAVESIDIFHTHGGEPVEGAGVIGHRFHCMSIPIPMYLDGKLQYVDYFGEDGIALRQSFDFPYIGPTTIYPYPHPEQVTLPQHIPVRRVTNKGSVLPEAYYDLIRDLCRLGLSSSEPVDVEGQGVAPYDFAIAYVTAREGAHSEGDRLRRAARLRLGGRPRAVGGPAAASTASTWPPPARRWARAPASRRPSARC